jgi:diadenosine tetraphosphate (Ap4A) HIT family hydrolase
MVIPISHKIYAYEVTPEEYQELTEIHLWMKDFYHNEEYFSFCRESLAARTIEHLHIHFLP